MSAIRRLGSGKSLRHKEKKVKEAHPSETLLPRSASIPFNNGRPKSPIANCSDSSDSGYEGPSYRLIKLAAIKTLSLKEMA